MCLYAFRVGKWDPITSVIPPVFFLSQIPQYALQLKNITSLKHQTHWTYLHMNQHNCRDRLCVWQVLSSIKVWSEKKGSKEVNDDHPAPFLFPLLQVEADTITQHGKAEFVFVQSYLVSDDFCWVICDKRITGLLAASPAVGTHFFLLVDLIAKRCLHPILSLSIAT